MDLDSFLISILFDSNKTQESARKIETTVNNLKDKIIGAFTAIASVDFLKNAIKSSIELTTKLDNLAYITNISKENLMGWGEAVKRNGGTTEGFYTSISSLSDKIRELQTNFGGPGTLAFARLGVNIQKSNGQMKTAVDILGELGDKFKNLPKVWQLNLGQQLGLDPATIRLISSGSESAQKLVQSMIKLGGLNQVNTERNLKLRNSLYDLKLVFNSIELTIANFLIPIVQKFTEMLIKAFQFLSEHTTILKLGILLISSLMSGILISAIASVTRSIVALSAALLANPFTLWIVAIAAFALVLDDFLGYLEGKKSAFESFYNAIAGSKFIKGIKYMTSALKEFADVLKEINNLTSKLFGKKFELGDVPDWATKNVPGYKEYLEKKSLKDKIKDAAISAGIDPNFALRIAQHESGFNPNAINDKSSASGIFQLTNATAQSNGISDLSKKNQIDVNIRAGINNLKNIAHGLHTFFNRDPTAGEVFLGEHLGLLGSKRLFNSDKNTMLSQLFNHSVLKANPQFKNMTSGQLINNANKIFDQKSVTVGEVKINAPNSNAQNIAKNISGALQQQLSMFVTNIDNGVRA